MILYRAALETRHFTFEAFSEMSPEVARAHLVRGLKKHGQKLNLPARWFEAFGADNFVANTVETGAAYRDGEKL